MCPGEVNISAVSLGHIPCEVKYNDSCLYARHKSPCENRYTGPLIRSFSVRNKRTTSLFLQFSYGGKAPAPIEKQFGLAPEPAMTLQTREKSTSSAAKWKTFTIKF
jgi:hypothetical protein